MVDSTLTNKNHMTMYLSNFQYLKLLKHPSDLENALFTSKTGKNDDSYPSDHILLQQKRLAQSFEFQVPL